MRHLKLCCMLLMAIITAALGLEFKHTTGASVLKNDAERSSPLTPINEAAGKTVLSSISSATQRYSLIASQSKFIAHALSGGLLWFKGHDHLVAIRDFTGQAQLTPDSITASSLEITAKAESMVETSDVFTPAQKQIIDKELREIVLEPDKYPDIVFGSTSVTGKATTNNQYDLTITGNLTLHGITHSITIPTKVTVSGNALRAQGEFSIERSDFKVKATSAVHGMIRVRDKVKFTFDIMAHRV